MVQQQLKPRLMGVVCEGVEAGMRSTMLCRLPSLIVIGLVKEADGSPRRRWVDQSITRSEPRPAWVTSWLPHCADCVKALWERGSGRSRHSFAPAYGRGPDRRYGLRAARRKPNSVKEHDLNLYVTLFISSLCTIAAEHGVTSSVQRLVNPAVHVLYIKLVTCI